MSEIISSNSDGPMEEPTKPIPALFASIRDEPEEIHRLNETLAERHRTDMVFYEASLAILRSVTPWADKVEKTHFNRWHPQPTSVSTPWAARLAAYQFGGLDAEATKRRFADFNERVLSPSPETRQAAVAEIFRWGRVSPRSPWTTDMAEKVVIAARDEAVPAREVPWSSSWTKVAAAATFDFEFDPALTRVPQVIWDSRVSFAVAELLGSACPPLLKEHLLIVPGKTDGRTTSGARAESLKRSGWKTASGTWTTRANAFWRSQRTGSRLIQMMSKQLNTHEEFRDERVSHPRWSSFDVALALFVEGY